MLELRREANNLLRNLLNILLNRVKSNEMKLLWGENGHEIFVC